MSASLRLLMIEDSESDAELVLHALARHGYSTEHRRVDDEPTLRQALGDAWEIVLCDHGLPGFSSFEALALVREHDHELPFVILSGTIGEEAAVEALRAGARDVVLKGNLARLGPVVDRELREAAIRRERAELEAQLNHAEKLDAIGRMAAGIAHDYRNLLGVVLGFSDLALQSLEAQHPAREHVAEIKTASERAIALTQQLLTFARIDGGTPDLVDVNDVVDGLEPMLRPLLGPDIAFAAVLEPELPCVLIDPRSLEQVIVNLTVNARDAMPGGGSFTLRTGQRLRAAGGAAPESGSQLERWAVVTASDTGVGIDGKVKTRIFEPFFTTKAPGRGTGLGLPSSLRIIERAGGTITVASEPQRGTTFEIRLPAAGVAGDASATAGAEPEPRARGGSETVLLVEDNEPLRRLLTQALASDGYKPLAAPDGAAAVALAERHAGPIDLLLTDVVMPAMRGTELARRLVRSRPQLRVMLMSAQPRPADADASADFIGKPFTLPALAVRSRELLDRGS